MEATMEDIKRKLFPKFLNTYWLRPEHSLAFSYEGEQFINFQKYFKSPSIDMACGDGITSFLFGGGEFGIDYDCYVDVKHDKVGFRFDPNNDDYYDTCDIEKFHSIDIKKYPDIRFDYGLDHKKELTQKAALLKIHNKLVVGDLNNQLDFEEGSFATIFSNSTYAMEKMGNVMTEYYRILKKGGHCFINVPDIRYQDTTIHRFIDQYGWSFLNQIDRGRNKVWMRHARKKEEWAKYFEEFGFKVVEQERYMPRIILDIQDIGLRPIFPSLAKMYDFIRNTDMNAWREIKEYSLENLSFILEPFLDLKWLEEHYDLDKKFIYFILEK